MPQPREIYRVLRYRGPLPGPTFPETSGPPRTASRSASPTTRPGRSTPGTCARATAPTDSSAPVAPGFRTVRPLIWLQRWTVRAHSLYFKIENPSYPCASSPSPSRPGGTSRRASTAGRGQQRLHRRDQASGVQSRPSSNWAIRPDARPGKRARTWPARARELPHEGHGYRAVPSRQTTLGIAPHEHPGRVAAARYPSSTSPPRVDHRVLGIPDPDVVSIPRPPAGSRRPRRSRAVRRGPPSSGATAR